MKFSIKGFVSKCYQIRSFLRIWSYLLEKLLMENFIFCAMLFIHNEVITQVHNSYKFVVITHLTVADPKALLHVKCSTLGLYWKSIKLYLLILI